MFVLPLKSITLQKMVKHVRTFSVAKIFDVTLRRGYAESTSAGGSSSGGDGFKAMDVCPMADIASAGSLTHNSLKPPPEISPCIFRKFSQADEQLGPGADKCGEYKNAEYYGYHMYSYANILVDILKMQQMREKTGTSPCPPKIEEQVKEATSATETEVTESKKTEQSVESKELKKSDDNQESKLQMVCCVTNEAEPKPCKSLPDEHILACLSDSEISDEETDDKCKDEIIEVEDNSIDACDEHAKKNKDGEDDEC